MTFERVDLKVGDSMTEDEIKGVLYDKETSGESRYYL